MNVKRFKVYKLEHATLGSYIGHTGNSLNQRWASHVSKSKRLELDHPLYKAMRSSDLGDWSMTILRRASSREEAMTLERGVIDTEKPKLNLKLYNGRMQEGYQWGGVKNKGRAVKRETREWFSNFHSTRPRKQKHSRTDMKNMKSQGYTNAEIARTLNCDAALVSRVVNGVYTH